MTLTANLLIAATGCSPQGADMLAAALEVAMQKREINTAIRQAHFLAQTAFESQGYTRYVENLNYRAERLLAVFPHYFGPGRADPNEYAGHPDRIANLVYANRMGNGPAESGDGFRYRGAGYIQLTGRANQEACAIAEGKDLYGIPFWLTTTEGAALSAAWFWQTRGCNQAADANSVATVTKIINGGLNGIDERTALTIRALDAFSQRS